MPLAPEQLAAVIRLQGSVEELRDSARAAPGGDNNRLAHIGEQLAALLRHAADVLPADGDLREEFLQLFPVAAEEPEIFWRDVEPRASALDGWFRGVIAAESFQQRIEAEARAYAQAKVQAERGVGFALPTAEEA